MGHFRSWSFWIFCGEIALLFYCVTTCLALLCYQVKLTWFCIKVCRPNCSYGSGRAGSHFLVCGGSSRIGSMRWWIGLGQLKVTHVQLRWSSERRLTTSMSCTIKQLNKILTAYDLIAYSNWLRRRAVLLALALVSCFHRDPLRCTSAKLTQIEAVTCHLFPFVSGLGYAYFCTLHGFVLEDWKHLT